METTASSDAAETAGRASGETVDATHPWLGLASFTEETRGYFHGREEEVAELCRRVQRKLLTILFGQSGLGKTSILRAGLVPRLRPEGYCPVYVRVDYSPESPAPSEQIKQAIFRATQASGAWSQSGVATDGESLWEFLHHRDDVLRDPAGRPLIPLLIFDQFEEIFTLAQSDDAGRQRAAQFVEDLADLVENRPPKALEQRLESDDTAMDRFDFARADYRILIALREDYLAHLEGLKAAMPSITQNRMRLARMNGAQALSAVVKPGGRLVSEEVAGAIVRFVAGGSELANAEVEPSLLSLICRELNNARIAQGGDEISAALLAGSRDTILAEFYERALADQPAGVRQVIEDNLLTESGYRESLAEERLVKAFAAAGAPADTLAKLVDRRLLRIEERLDLRRVELTHDVLCGVVGASRDLRLEREARDAAEKQLEAQQARERATREALVRARKIATACAVLAVVALAGAVFGWVSMKRAQEAEAQAETTRLMAEQARAEAEKLVVYLLEDFNLELAPVGRLDIVAELAKRALDYYNALPAPLRTAQTERNRALALVRYGSVLRTLARLDEGTKAIEEAIAVLGKLRDQGDRSETTAIGLALGLSTKARLASSIGRDGAALATSNSAVEILAPLATVPNASVALRRAYGEVLNMNGYLQMQNRQEAAAVATLDRSRDAAKSIDNLAMTDLGSAALYAESTSWQVHSMRALGRTDEAKRLAAEGTGIATKVIAKRPGHMQALRALALTTSPLSSILIDEMRLSDALVQAESTIRAWRELVRIDPGNAISWNNLLVAYDLKSEILLAMGRITEAKATLREALEVDRQTTPTLMTKGNLSFRAGRLALIEADQGNAREAHDAMALAGHHGDWIVANVPNDFLKAITPLRGEWFQAEVAYGLGDYRRSLTFGLPVVGKLAQLKVSNEAQRRDQEFVLRWIQFTNANAAFHLKDYATADREVAAARQWHVKVGDHSLSDRRLANRMRTLAAAVAARLGRTDEARTLATQALAFEREIAERKHDDPSQRFDLAMALYAAAIAGVGDSAAQLAESAALMERLPPEYRRLRTVSVWRDLVADARVRR